MNGKPHLSHASPIRAIRPGAAAAPPLGSYLDVALREKGLAVCKCGVVGKRGSELVRYPEPRGPFWCAACLRKRGSARARGIARAAQNTS